MDSFWTIFSAVGGASLLSALITQLIRGYSDKQKWRRELLYSQRLQAYTALLEAMYEQASLEQAAPHFVAKLDKCFKLALLVASEQTKDKLTQYYSAISPQSETREQAVKLGTELMDSMRNDLSDPSKT